MTAIDLVGDLSPVDLLHCCREAPIQHHDKPDSGAQEEANFTIFERTISPPFDMLHIREQ